MKPLRTFPHDAREIGKEAALADTALQRALEMTARREALERQPKDNMPRALYISPGGGGAGANTYIHAVLELAGVRNLQAELGFTGW